MGGQSENSIYLIPLKEKFILYAPLHGIWAIFNESAARALQLSLKENIEPKHDVLLKLTESLKNSSSSVPAQHSGDLSPAFLGIIPTRACNSHCRYCDFGSDGINQSIMTLDLAIKAVNWYLEIVLKNKQDKLSIHFFGGEPMVAPGVVTTVVHRARLLADKHNLVTDFEISTNGQYSADWTQFLGDYFSTIVLSFDGMEEVHNYHRPGINRKESFSRAVRTAKIIKESQADLCLRACISSLNQDDMEDITEWFCQEFNPSYINFEMLQPTELAEKNDLFPPDPLLFASNFIKSRNIAAKYGIDLVYASDIVSPQWTSCPVGKDTAIVTPDGIISSCYLLAERWQSKGLDLSFGKFEGKVNIEKEAVDRIRDLVTVKPMCESCFCRWSCAGGCHVDNVQNKNGMRNNFCIQTRVISVATLLDDLEPGSGAVELDQEIDVINNIVKRESDLLIDWEFEDDCN